MSWVEQPPRLLLPPGGAELPQLEHLAVRSSFFLHLHRDAQLPPPQTAAASGHLSGSISTAALGGELHLFTSTHRFAQPPGVCASATANTRTRTLVEQVRRRQPLFKRRCARSCSRANPHRITSQHDAPARCSLAAKLRVVSAPQDPGAPQRRAPLSQSQARTQHARRTKKTQP